MHRGADTRSAGFEPCASWPPTVLWLLPPSPLVPLALPPCVLGLGTTTDPAAVPMSGVNLGEAMMGVKGTKGRRFVWLVRDDRSAEE